LVHRPLSSRWRALALTVTALASCSGLDPIGDEASARLDTFDFYWQQLADDYPLFGQQSVDWNELRRRYRAAVPFTGAPHEFYHLLTGMLSELGDVHVGLDVPDERFADAGVEPTSLLDVPGFELMPIEGRLHVVGWPADQAPRVPQGVPETSAYPEVWRVEGFPVVLSLVQNLLLGPPDTEVELQLRWRHGVVTRHVLRRPPAGTAHSNSPFGHLASTGRSLRVRRTQPFAWLTIDNLGDEKAIGKLQAAIDRATPAQGLVLDLRCNPGGLFLVAQGLVEPFLREPIELVLAPPHPSSSWLGLFEVEVFFRQEWQPRAPRYAGPVVVLTSALTGSAAEHAARVLQRYAGAVLIGERTVGAEAVLQEAIGPDGGELRFGSMRVLERTGVGLQQAGVVPDISIRLTLDDLERLGPEAAAADWEERLLAAAREAIERGRGRLVAPAGEVAGPSR
jgi:carboxyl-terminal processing protease